MNGGVEELIKLYGEGLQSFYSGDYKCSVEHFQNAVVKSPDSPTLHNDLATALWSVGDKSKAIEHWQTSWKLDSANRIVTESLVSALVDCGEYQQAQAVCSSYLKFAPNDSQIIGLMRQLSENGTEKTPASALMDRADELAREGKDREVFQQYLEVAKLAPLEKADASRYASFYLSLYLKEHKEIYQASKAAGTLEDRSCPVCGAEHSPLALEGTIGTQYVKCNSCDLLYMSPIVNQDDLEKVYSQHEDSCKTLMWTYNKNMLKKLETPPSSFPDRIYKIREHCPNGQLLDFGSSLGSLLNQAKFFFQVAGVEIDPITSQFSRDVLGLEEIYNNDVFDPSLDQHLANRFDVVTLIQVIEHLTDPKAMLTRLKDFMKPGGHIFIECPNYRSTSIEWFGANQHLLMGVEHVVMFSRSSLGKLLESLGFEIVISETFHLDIEVYDIIAHYLRTEYGQFSLHRHGARSEKSLAQFDKINEFVTGAVSNALQNNPDHGSYLRVMAKLR